MPTQGCYFSCMDYCCWPFFLWTWTPLLSKSDYLFWPLSSGWDDFDGPPSLQTNISLLSTLRLSRCPLFKVTPFPLVSPSFTVPAPFFYPPPIWPSLYAPGKWSVNSGPSLGSQSSAKWPYRCHHSVGRLFRLRSESWTVSWWCFAIWLSGLQAPFLSDLPSQRTAAWRTLRCSRRHRKTHHLVPKFPLPLDPNCFPCCRHPSP